MLGDGPCLDLNKKDLIRWNAQQSGVFQTTQFHFQWSVCWFSLALITELKETLIACRTNRIETETRKAELETNLSTNL
ncbi:hypothetical protein LOK49_LG12G01816 [Camellia lanceoleosa]|uniref:Uncharacterized protein n=1 Tax=Camellia lanceoleosa TaxID=1840588 RepID=A0ACC0FSX4_9ERIC|nr:hypothetical protein LOK49_LG12G01816 [Camellia lanceoleosa]